MRKWRGNRLLLPVLFCWFSVIWCRCKCILHLHLHPSFLISLSLFIYSIWHIFKLCLNCMNSAIQHTHIHTPMPPVPYCKAVKQPVNGVNYWWKNYITISLLRAHCVTSTCKHKTQDQNNYCSLNCTHLTKQEQMCSSLQDKSVMARRLLPLCCVICSLGDYLFLAVCFLAQTSLRYVRKHTHTKGESLNSSHCLKVEWCYFFLICKQCKSILPD